MKAPFPWFGGKSRVADLVWQRFGDTPNYVEPFAGSLAVLLNRPHDPHTETVNDMDAYLSNFWRALQADPSGLARWADWPVSEADLHARHMWLVQQTGFRERMLIDPDYFDAKIAGWWVWGLCSWIGTGWCRSASRQLPHLGDGGQGLKRQGVKIQEYFHDLAERLRRTRVSCGDWRRVMGESVTTKHGITAVFLDPPYDSAEHEVQYSAHSNVSAEVRAWAVENQDNPLLRIALCGYDGEHNLPDSWECVAWKARGGYGSQGDGKGRDNAERERVWFSPHCLKPHKQVQQALFAEFAQAERNGNAA